MKQVKPQYPQTVTFTVTVGGLRVETTVNFSQNEPPGPNNPYVMSVVQWLGDGDASQADGVQPTVTVDWEDVELLRGQGSGPRLAERVAASRRREEG